MAQSKQKRPEPAVSAQGEQNCPWFHLNSRLADAHSSPGNGGDRQGISAPRLQGACSSASPQGLTPAALSLCRGMGDTSPCHCLLDIVRTVSRFHQNVKAESHRSRTRQGTLSPGPWSDPLSEAQKKAALSGGLSQFTFSTDRRPRSPGGWAPFLWSRSSHWAHPAAPYGSHAAHRHS